MILKASLLMIPAVMILAFYSSVVLASQWETETANGDPVTRQHFVWIDADIASWLVILFILLPNSILAIGFIAGYNRDRQLNS